MCYRPRPVLAGTAGKRPAAPLVRDEEAAGSNPATPTRSEGVPLIEVFSAGLSQLHWNVISDLDLSALESITPDDAVTRLRYVIRDMPGSKAR